MSNSDRYKILMLSLSGLLIICTELNARQQWTVAEEIETHLYHLYEGKIDGKYPIEIYLKEEFDFCDDRPFPTKPKIVYGWYQYKKIGKKIPVAGYICRESTCDQYLKIMVMKDPLSGLQNQNCEENPFSEVFVQKEKDGLMTWQGQDGRVFPVELRTVHPYSYQTNASIILRINEVEIRRFDLSALSANRYIDSIEILGQRHVDGIFHLLMEYGYLSNPASGGMGRCGAGEEKYLGYLVLDEDFKVTNFKNIQTESCLFDIYETNVDYDPTHPERGFKVK